MNRGDAVTGIQLARDAADRWDELVETGAAEHRRDIDTAVRKAREAGLSLADIARAGGWSRSRAQQLVARATKPAD